MANPITSQFQNRALHFILDWDDTLTYKDTLDFLVKIAKDGSPNPRRISADWERLKREYSEDYEKTLKEKTPNGLPKNIIEERRLLKALEVVEKRSIQRVSDSGIFKGLGNYALLEGATKSMDSRERSWENKVMMRTGWNVFIAYVHQRIRDKQHVELDHVDILSTNWSQAFIFTCLTSASPRPELAAQYSFMTQLSTPYGLSRDWDLQILVNDEKSQYFEDCSLKPYMTIYANELELRAGGYTGKVCDEKYPKIVSSADKLAYLHKLRRISPYSIKPIPIVYVGDGWNDLECLLAADLGICIRNPEDKMTSSMKKLADSFKRLGIKCPHIKDFKNVDEWGVVWASNFNEITDWLKVIECSKGNSSFDMA
ncbi:hypothetical protein K469DRAFT_708456 [Zopfia rhizophila CBS 207.26]|uniref:Haloacid dehalogenase-like hydrolase n=1 Tax=Zopfia rhizophila CBS 207.26 TaxID=1314779 RepID=A0A6A6E342_9PEZI|nr:hypothetical protein K469DRAFT_708456 [Zopfia rhizophila CBS 207.26]